MDLGRCKIKGKKICKSLSRKYTIFTTAHKLILQGYFQLQFDSHCEPWRKSLMLSRLDSAIAVVLSTLSICQTRQTRETYKKVSFGKMAFRVLLL